jgi:hypothetical protein
MIYGTDLGSFPVTSFVVSDLEVSDSATRYQDIILTAGRICN